MVQFKIIYMHFNYFFKQIYPTRIFNLSVLVNLTTNLIITLLFNVFETAAREKCTRIK